MPSVTKSSPISRVLPSGDTALVVELGDTIDRAVSARVVSLARRLDEARAVDENLAGIVELVPTFRSLMVVFDPLRVRRRKLVARIEGLLDGLDATAAPGRRWRLPACYEGDLAPDLADVAQRTGLAPAAIVDAHAATIFHVYMMGFQPGFGYLGDLPPTLNLPRREEPRVRVPAGSISIATTLTAIYVFDSPGGWHLIGRTPARLWDAQRPRPALLAAGDSVIFEPIPRARYDALMAAGGWDAGPDAAVNGEMETSA